MNGQRPNPIVSPVGATTELSRSLIRLNWDAEVRIRRFNPNDLDAVVHLVHLTMDVSYGETYCEEAREAFKGFASSDRILDEAEEGLTVVAEQAGRIVGTAARVGCEISRTYVHPDLQGHGVGKALMDSLEMDAAEHGISELHLHSSLNAEPFYLALGYEITETGSYPVANGQELPYFRMRKRL